MNSRICMTLSGIVGLGISTPAHAEWWEATTDHFIVYSQSSERDTRSFAQLLDRFDGALRVLQGMPVGQDVGPANKVMVFRSGDRDDIGRLAGSDGVAGFYLPRAGRPVAFVPAHETMQRGSRHFEGDDPNTLDSTRVLFHEYTHHFMLQSFPATYPAWYVEGFAELNATITFRENGTFHVGDPPQYRAYELFEMSQMPLRKLLDSKYKTAGYEEWIQRYGLGWLLSHYLSFSKERSGQLPAYLKAIGTGEDSLTAALRIFGDLGQLERELRKYKGGQLPGIDVKPANLVPPRVAMRRLEPNEERLMRSRIRLARGVDRKGAADVLSDLQSLGDWIAGSAPAQIALAEAYLDSERYADANAAADRALSLSPDLPQAYIYKARALIEADDKANPDPNRFATARAQLIKARKADPTNPEPLILYYKSYAKAHQPAPDQATLALETAFTHAAFDSDYRLTLTGYLLEAGRGRDARTVLMPVVFNVHEDEAESRKAVPTANLHKVLDLLDADDVIGARSEFEAYTAEAERKAGEGK